MAGGIRVAAIYADRLQRRGHDVVVVSTPRRPLPLSRKMKIFAKGRGWPVDPTEQWPSHLDSVDVDHRILKKYGPVTDADIPDADVVIATWWETAEWVAKLSPRKGAKAYLIQHDESLFEHQPADRVAATWNLPLHKIVISKWLAELAVDRCGAETISHVPNSVDMAQFHAPRRGKQATPTVGVLYNPTPFKGYAQARQAIERARTIIPNLHCVAFGNFNVTTDQPLPPDCTFFKRPPQEKIREIYAACDVWLCGSRSEGFHLPPLEAMACRCPVVSTRVGGPMDTIIDGVNGYIVDVDDVTSLADRLVSVLQSPEADWQAMSDAAYATAERYTWDDATDLLEAALDRAIAKVTTLKAEPFVVRTRSEPLLISGDQL